MTRKKIVKQLMAQGLSRNRANFHATLCRDKGISYAEYYAAVAPWLIPTRETRRATVKMRMVAGYLCSGLARAAANVEKLRAALVAHHVRPITPDNLEGGNILIVTRQEHEALHGYSAKIAIVDELETAGGAKE